MCIRDRFYAFQINGFHSAKGSLLLKRYAKIYGRDKKIDATQFSIESKIQSR